MTNGEKTIEILTEMRNEINNRVCTSQDVYEMEALEQAISALRARDSKGVEIDPVKPLTLDELRGMDGEPVYIVTLENQLENPPYWAIVGISKNDSRYQGGVTLYNKTQGDWGSIELYGKTWLAYRRPPEMLVGIDLASGHDFTAYGRPPERSEGKYDG